MSCINNQINSNHIYSEDDFNNHVEALNHEYGVVCLNGTTVVLRTFLSPSTNEVEVQLLTFKDFKDLLLNRDLMV